MCDYWPLWPICAVQLSRFKNIMQTLELGVMYAMLKSRYKSVLWKQLFTVRCVGGHIGENIPDLRKEVKGCRMISWGKKDLFLKSCGKKQWVLMKTLTLTPFSFPISLSSLPTAFLKPISPFYKVTLGQKKLHQLQHPSVPSPFIPLSLSIPSSFSSLSISTLYNFRLFALIAALHIPHSATYIPEVITWSFSSSLEGVPTHA